MQILSVYVALEDKNCLKTLFKDICKCFTNIYKKQNVNNTGSAICIYFCSLVNVILRSGRIGS